MKEYVTPVTNLSDYQYTDYLYEVNDLEAPETYSQALSGYMQ